MPALVCTFRNSQRGFTRKVSSLVTLRLSFGEMGAALAAAGRCAAASNAATPTPPNAPAITDRREEDLFIGMTHLLYPGDNQRRKPTHSRLSVFIRGQLLVCAGREWTRMLFLRCPVQRNSAKDKPARIHFAITRAA